MMNLGKAYVPDVLWYFKHAYIGNNFRYMETWNCDTFVHQVATVFPLVWIDKISVKSKMFNRASSFKSFAAFISP